MFFTCYCDFVFFKQNCQRKVIEIAEFLKISLNFDFLLQITFGAGVYVGIYLSQNYEVK